MSTSPNLKPRTLHAVYGCVYPSWVKPLYSRGRQAPLDDCFCKAYRRGLNLSVAVLHNTARASVTPQARLLFSAPLCMAGSSSPPPPLRRVVGFAARLNKRSSSSSSSERTLDAGRCDTGSPSSLTTELQRAPVAPRKQADHKARSAPAVEATELEATSRRSSTVPVYIPAGARRVLAPGSSAAER